jgi:O6-methylguanine-DNA--protein-cysteine methyltransferase
MRKKVFKTSLGWVGVAVSNKGVCRIVLPRKEKSMVMKELQGEEPFVGQSFSHAKILEKTVKLLQSYFSGTRVLFDLPVDIRSFTAFQRAVWKAASAIPFGETRSYGWIATRIRRPQAARAVGQAMGANPVPVIIP